MHNDEGRTENQTPPQTSTSPMDDLIIEWRIGQLNWFT